MSGARVTEAIAARAPGELSDVFGLTPHGDSLLVYTGARVQLFSPGLGLVREAPVSSMLWVVRALAGGGFVGSSMTYGSPATLHVLDSAFREVRRFGPGPEAGAMDPRALAPTGRGDFCASVPGAYRLERWSADGRPLQTIERATDLFDTWTRADAFNRDRFGKPPLPRIVGLQARSEGLAVLLRVQVANWVSTRGPSGEGGGMPDLATIDSRDDHVLEVLDESSGAARVSVRLAFYALALAEPDLILPVREDFLGIRRFDVWWAVIDEEP